MMDEGENMSKKEMITAEVIGQEMLLSGIYSLELFCPKAAEKAKAGQFVSLYTADERHLLPRPISLCEIDKKHGTLRLVYRVAGAGTESFSKLRAGDTLRLLGPLGNGYPVLSGKVLLIGGGIGIPPLVELGKELSGYGCEVVSAMGYRNELFLTKELTKLGELIIATEDGSAGTKGTVLDALKEHPVSCDTVCACGPTPMLKAVKEWALLRDIPCYISLEERMACGIGACLGCVCNSTEVDDHSMVKKKRVCKDGPVFLSTEVEL